jgi:hypothetical protein
MGWLEAGLDAEREFLSLFTLRLSSLLLSSLLQYGVGTNVDRTNAKAIALVSKKDTVPAPMEGYTCTRHTTRGQK